MGCSVGNQRSVNEKGTDSGHFDILASAVYVHPQGIAETNNSKLRCTGRKIIYEIIMTESDAKNKTLQLMVCGFAVKTSYVVM